MDNESELSKILLIGDSAVGKTSMFQYFKSGQVLNNLPPTMGCEYHIVSQDIDGKIYKFFFWDTAGQEKYRSIVPQWYRGSKGVVMVFSLTDRNSFNNVTRWVMDLKNHIDGFSMVIVGNKADLVDQRVVKFEEGEQLASSLGVKYFETTIYQDKMAKDCTKINQIFLFVLRDILKSNNDR